MPKPKGKAKHNVSALTKAVKTNRHVAPSTAASNTVCLGIRQAAATSVFSALAASPEAGRKAPTKTGIKTVLAAESAINVDRRVRNAAVPVGIAVKDIASVEEDLSIELFDISRAVRHLMPRRPPWSFDLSSGRLHHREVKSFKQWLDDVQEAMIERGGYPPAFEQNLQVWRQLWRVLERCDVAVVVCDARHPLLHLPPALAYHVYRTLRKPLVVVLNKLDAIDPADAMKWAECLQAGIPGVSAVVGYCSKGQLKSDDFGAMPVGKEALIEICHRVYAEWQEAAEKTGQVAPEKPALSKEEQDNGAAAAHSRVMLGLVGHPNVGKSSMVNSMMGGKFVSVKATPGHTKTLQTLVLDDRTCLCDSPGVVFPRLEVPRETQIVGMLIPLAQVREPFSALRWVMERQTTPLPELLHLKPVTLQQAMELKEAGTDAIKLDGIDSDEAFVPWSPMLLCAQYAVQRGLLQGGRPDCMKAGMEILERVLEGRVPYAVRPPSKVPARDGGVGDDDESSGSDWQLEDEEYESEPEPPEADVGLFEAFGVDPKGPGKSSIASRKKHEKQRLRAEQEGED
mmetsp:Transcript_41817/g.91245  ORF Transcript_41817/g.91245 Transcript_41817/m.91245 type:complete len:569 (+) Transcript_41817:39-1745(+)